MDIITRISAVLCPVLLLGACSGPAATFTRPPGVEVYPATDNVSEIELLPDRPAREFLAVGSVESRAGSVEEALPALIWQARAHGGEALWNLRAVQAGKDGPIIYRADVIRWVSHAPAETPAR